MLTIEMAIQKIQQFTPEQRNKVIEFIEFLEFQSSQTENIDQQTNKEPTKTSFAKAAHEFVGCLDSDIKEKSSENDK